MGRVGNSRSKAQVADNALVNAISDECGPIIDGMGFTPVDVTAGRSHQTTHVQIVVYRSGDLGVDDLASLARSIKSRLELVAGRQDIALTVTSPGTGRTIRSPREYSIFKGRGIRVLLTEEPDWISGVIAEFEQSVLLLRNGDELRRIPVGTIRKARLDDSQEVVK